MYEMPCKVYTFFCPICRKAESFEAKSKTNPGQCVDKQARDKGWDTKKRGVWICPECANRKR